MQAGVVDVEQTGGLEGGACASSVAMPAPSAAAVLWEVGSVGGSGCDESGFVGEDDGLDAVA